jgi:8-oxo-dGTP pyrophosphatase MutT (NUDIX family)
MSKLPDQAGSRPEPPQKILLQAAALPFRQEADGSLVVLLIRRRQKRRWGIPKGIIEPNQTDREAALQEALEEAGVAGTLSDQPVGVFEYAKWGYCCRVIVYALRVSKEYAQYDEMVFRERRWFALSRALECKTRKGIRPLLGRLGPGRFGAPSRVPPAGPGSPPTGTRRPT